MKLYCSHKIRHRSLMYCLSVTAAFEYIITFIITLQKMDDRSRSRSRSPLRRSQSPSPAPAGSQDQAASPAQPAAPDTGQGRGRGRGRGARRGTAPRSTAAGRPAAALSCRNRGWRHNNTRARPEHSQHCTMICCQYCQCELDQSSECDDSVCSDH